MCRHLFVFKLQAALATLMAIAFNTTALAAAQEGESVPGEFAPEHSRLTLLNKQIELEMLKLARFNINFTRTANRHQKWRTLSYAAAREAGTALSYSNTLTDLAQTARGLSNKARRISKISRRRAVAAYLTGSAISAGASSLELAQNTWIMMQAKKQGYSPAESLSFVKSIVHKTDDLFKERERIIANLPDDKFRKVHEMEARLLQRLRQQLLYEFRKWSCNSRDLAWRENSFYFLDAISNYAALQSNICSLRGFHQPALAGKSAIWALVSNSIATLNPPVSNLLGFAVRKYQKHKLARELPSIDRPFMEQGCSVQELKDMQADLGQTNAELLEESIFLASNSERMDDSLDKEVRDIDRSREIAQQQAISGPLIGLTGVARSTLSTVAFYCYNKDRNTATKITFAGRIPQTVGQTYALINTPYTVTRGIIRTNRLKAKGELPSQRLEQRLKRLDGLEKKILSDMDDNP